MALTIAVVNSKADTTVRSGPSKVALIELYTSEGCSSCPPAEKWLGELRGDPGLWEKFVPVAFHVNYWDRLGWRDVFATRESTEREYRYAQVWHASSVYTPCFVRDGEEWRPRDRPASPNSSQAAGELTITRTSEGECRVTFVPSHGVKDLPANLDVSVALLGAGIVSPVRAGENSGRELHHEFVAVAWMTEALLHRDDGSSYATLTLKVPSDRTFPVMARTALVAWVTPHDSLKPVQAAGGWIESVPGE